MRHESCTGRGFSHIETEEENMLDKWFEDIGKKIKALAKWGFIVESVGILLACLIMIFDEPEFFFLLLLAPVGVALAYVSSWLLYGLGELIDKTVDNERNTHKIARILDRMEKGEEAPKAAQTTELPPVLRTTAAPAPKSQPQPAEGWTCSCGRWHPKNETGCICGKVNPILRAAFTKPKSAPMRAAPVTPVVSAPEKPLKEQLTYALRYQTNEGMISYLESLRNEELRPLLQQPKNQIRGLVQQKINTL